MKMKFKVSNDYCADEFNLQPGIKITFTLIKLGNRYEISSIQKMEH